MTPAYNPYHFCQLANGLRVVHCQSASHVMYCGYALKVGARDERPDEEGMAHYNEHMSFKGTERRTSTAVINYLERVGGDLNA